MEDVKAKDISSIAANMAKIVQSLKNGDYDDKGPSVVLKVYTPEVKNLSAYQVIDV